MRHPVDNSIRVNDCYVLRRKGQEDLLCFDVLHGLRHLYTMQLMVTYDAELNLQHGRFENFTREHQEHVVNLRFDGYGHEIQKKFGDIVTWLAEQGAVWTFTPKPESVGKSSIDFEFENPTTAVVFKLVWY